MEQVVKIGKCIWAMSEKGIGEMVTLTPLEGYGTFYQASGEHKLRIQARGVDASERKPGNENSLGEAS